MQVPDSEAGRPLSPVPLVGGDKGLQGWGRRAGRGEQVGGAAREGPSGSEKLGGAAQEAEEPEKLKREEGELRKGESGQVAEGESAPGTCWLGLS